MGNRTRTAQHRYRLQQVLPLRDGLSDVDWGEKILMVLFSQVMVSLDDSIPMETMNKIALVEIDRMMPLLLPEQTAAVVACKAVHPEHPRVVMVNPGARLDLQKALDRIEALPPEEKAAALDLLRRMKPVYDARVVNEPDRDLNDS